MIRIRIFQIAFCLPILFVSCSKPPVDTPTPIPSVTTAKPVVTQSASTASPKSTTTSTPQWFMAIQSTPLVMQPLATPSPDPTALAEWATNLEFTTNSITDGTLVLFVREEAPKCHSISNPENLSMNVEFAFINITDEPLRIPTRFAVTVSGGTRSDINPFYFSEDGKRIRLKEWFIDDTPLGGYRSFSEIPGGESYMVVINIPLSNSLAPGYYLMKFVYDSHDLPSSSRNSDIWIGKISSNTIEVCLGQ